MVVSDHWGEDMPYRVSWGSGPGVVTVVARTAREALSVAAAYEAEGRTGVQVVTLDGAPLSILELKALAEVDDGAPPPAAD